MSEGCASRWMKYLTNTESPRLGERHVGVAGRVVAGSLERSVVRDTA